MLGHMLFGRRGSDFFDVSFDSVDSVDGDDAYRGISGTLEFSVGRFEGGFPAYFFAGEIRQLLTDLQELSRTMTGSASFNALEAQLAFSATLQATGSLNVSGELRDDPGLGNRLLFAMKLDQTYLASPISSLERFVSEQL